LTGSWPAAAVDPALAVSLDGFVARSDGVIDWLSTRRSGCVDHGDHRHHANLEMLGQIGLVVLGRRAYEEMALAWSSSDSPMARILNALPKIVLPTAARRSSGTPPAPGPPGPTDHRA
jgi:dihydrofolate reductase